MRLGREECTKRLTSLRLEYVAKHTHDSLLFNHYEIWFEVRRSKAWSYFNLVFLGLVISDFEASNVAIS